MTRLAGVTTIGAVVWAAAAAVVLRVFHLSVYPKAPAASQTETPSPGPARSRLQGPSGGRGGQHPCFGEVVRMPKRPSTEGRSPLHDLEHVAADSSARRWLPYCRCGWVGPVATSYLAACVEHGIHATFADVPA